MHNQRNPLTAQYPARATHITFNPGTATKPPAASNEAMINPHTKSPEPVCRFMEEPQECSATPPAVNEKTGAQLNTAYSGPLILGALCV